ncbi:hypothetical protein [Planktosalinus lacus]|uniref:Uncharacterized protein n=1 Tax=Planktosalinus lacus TaxID=1526573 RepID=A0A8J2V8Z9_9FLAO|nr:hypothetical protein [Planktosalinus lacus]GGD86901.1 hypothetical protein GCM10011312_08680 [Planktosalinus lacus]
MKYFVALLLILSIVSCNTEKSKTGILTDFVPEESALILKSTNFSTLTSDIKNNGFLSQFTSHPAYNYFGENLEFSKYLHPISEVLISVKTENDSTHHLTLITREHPELFNLDSAQNKIVETLAYNEIKLQRVTLDSKIIYTTTLDSVFIAGSSQEIIERIIKKHKQPKTNPDNGFETIYNTLGASDFSVMVNGRLIQKTLKSSFPKIDQLPHIADWIAFDSEIQPGQLKLNGIAIAQDTLPQLLNVFKGTRPQRNLLAMVTPSSASGFISVTYDDFDILKNNLAAFHNTTDTIANHRPLFSSLNEIGVISIEDEKVVAMHAIDGSVTKDFLNPLLEEIAVYRDIPIHKISDSAVFKNNFSPLITTTPLLSAQLDDYFIFAEEQATLEKIITEYFNETTVGNLPYYKEHMQHMSSESSILIVALLPNFKNTFADWASGNSKEKIQQLKFGSHRMAAFQFVYDSHFAHFNGVIKETQNQSRGTGVSQLFAINLENELLSRPQFFNNHITKGKDVVVQDVANELYLISSTGKVLWSKQLDSEIIGDIQEVDLLKNGKTQLAFTTKNTFYILDRNGRAVSPFPMKFKDDITQPLSVFDYDNNRNYRFIIIQGEEIFMYDNKGKSVKGFIFKKANSPILLPPKHIRILNKDYIIIAEENGTINILHRTGQPRINVSQKFDFSENQIYTENNEFVILNTNDEKISIDQNGKVSKQNISSVSKNVFWEIIGNTKVTLDDNILRINNQKIELPFGLYTAPKISVSNRRILVTITDLQQQRSYAFNSLGELLNNFPIYGTSIMEMADATNNGKPNGVVKGGAKEVVLYEIN